MTRPSEPRRAWCDTCQVEGGVCTCGDLYRWARATAPTPFTFPTPGGRTNAAAVPVAERDLCELLLGARLHAEFVRPLDPADAAALETLYDRYVERLGAVAATALEVIVEQYVPLLAAAVRAHGPRPRNVLS